MTKGRGPAGSGSHSVALHRIGHGVCFVQVSAGEAVFSQNTDLGMHGARPPLTAFSRSVSRSGNLLLAGLGAVWKHQAGALRCLTLDKTLSRVPHIPPRLSLPEVFPRPVWNLPAVHRCLNGFLWY